ncbi:hypothetical protein [Saccharothrix syringae]|uniref:hypothetical protein n=1 Tax=Saccharothrix syringae TaxID=103733 RepID=UPI000525609A|nr:hypothetical protein [Saccharothrix syringae]
MNQNEEPAKSRRRFAERLACTLVFTAVQLWAAVVVLVETDARGPLAAAVALVLAGGVIAMYDAWHDVRSAHRSREVERRRREEPSPPVAHAAR